MGGWVGRCLPFSVVGVVPVPAGHGGTGNAHPKGAGGLFVWGRWVGGWVGKGLFGIVGR